MMNKLVNKPHDPNSALKRQETFTLPAYETTPSETNYSIPKPDTSTGSESAALPAVKTPVASKKLSARPNLEALQEAVDNVNNPRESESEGSTADVKINDNKKFREVLRSSSTHWSSADDLESCKTPPHDSKNNLAASKVRDVEAKEVDTAPKDAGPQFGWIKGVLVRCLLNIWSVLLFIRLSWVVGEAGVMYASAIILLSAVVCGVTALSMSAICTNGVVRGGGAYYMISRSLGPEFGGAIGLVFGLANAVAAAMHIVGFAETASNVLIQYDMPIVRGHPLHDIRIIGCVTLVILFGIVMIGMEWEARAQLVSLVVLLCAMANFVVGTFLSPNDDKLSRGFTGYSGQTFAKNFGPAFRDHSFVEVFAVFFPAATGILAGANISGDLRDAQSAIPKGTLLAILIATSVYLMFVWILGATIVREAVGPFAAAVAGAMTMADNITGTTQKASLTLNDTSLDVANAPNYQCDGESKCAFGLLNDFRAVEMASAFGPLILAGIVAAASSSALAALISAPKVMQALATDKLFPYIHVLAKGYGKNNEPWRAYVVTFIIAAACIGIAELNMIAMIISQFFLTVYALINYACFDASRSSSPGFRPRFRYYSKWTALFGAVLCLAAMFAMSWRAALVATVVIGLLWFYIHQVSKPQVSWGTSYEANIYRRTLEGAIKLTTEVEEHVKTYRPQVLVLCGNPAHRPALVDIAGAFAGDARALMICANVLCTPSVLITGKKQQKVEPRSLREQRQQLQDEAYDWLKRRNVQAFYAQISSADSVRAGARALMECAGVGRLRPNVVFLGYLTSWLSAFDSGGMKNNRAPTLSVEEYVGIIRDAFELNMGVGVLHMSSNGMDTCELFHQKNAGTLVDERDGEHSALGIHPQEHTNLVALSSTPHKSLSAYDLTHSDEHQLSRLNPIESILMNKSKMTNRFQDDVLEATSKEIHVWWLYDDGGLTVLIPYLLSQKWKQFKLKIFYLASSTSASDALDDNVPRRASNTSKNSKVSNVQTTETRRVNRSESEKTVETAERQSTPDKQEEPMMRLLGKLRIEVDAATPVSLTKPTAEERNEMLRTVKTYLGRYYAGNKFSEEDLPKPSVQAEATTTVTSEQEFEAHSEQTLRKLLLCKHIRERSQKAALVVVSLPMHGRQTSPALYMTWLDCLTGALSPSSSGSTRRSEQDLEQVKETTRLTASSVACGESMPPILLLRGNQQNVLTLDL